MTPEQMQDKAFYKLVEENSEALTALAGTGREGALNALDRLYEENEEGLKRLANMDDKEQNLNLHQEMFNAN